MKDIYLCTDCAMSRARIENENYEDYEVDPSDIPAEKLDESEQYCTCDSCGSIHHIWTYDTYKFFSY